MCGLLAFASNSLLYIHHPTPTMIAKIIITIKRGASNSMRNTIAAGFCPTTTKHKRDLIPYLLRSKKWTGWELNPRPQQC
jgi:hypothetical protein